MRAHFASDVPASPDDTDDVALNQHQGTETLKAQSATAESQDVLKTRIMEFKSDSTKMAVVGEFIDEVLEKAEEEANKQQDDQNKSSQQNKTKSQKQNFAIPDFKNGKVVNKARGFVVRLFESICNCANSAAAAPVTRFKFRSGKRASTSATEAGAETNGKTESIRKEEKSKKSGNGKEKKNEKIKFKDEKEEVQPEAIELQ